MDLPKYPMKRSRDWPGVDIKTDEKYGREYFGDFGGIIQPTSPDQKIIVKKIKEDPELEINTTDTRINFCLAPGDKLIECPYQKNHLILEQRWIRHLCKCRSNYLKECAAKKQGIEIGICKWNNGHHYQIQELENHEQECFDRRYDPYIEQEMDFFTGPNPKSLIENLQREKISVAIGNRILIEGNGDEKCEEKLKLVDTKENFEDWEVEPTTVTSGQPAYNPRRAILQKNIPFIPIPPGLTKSERGNYRILQTARVIHGPAYTGNTD